MLFMLVIPTMSHAQGITSAKECQECHKDIYAEWNTSRHAASNAALNPFYAAMLEWANKASNNKLETQCEKCHEPAKSLVMDPLLIKSTVKQGVTCDVCHATKTVNQNKGSWFELQPGNVKYGPIEDAVSNSHECVYSPAHKESSFCLTCHSNAETPHGISFCSTEKEYKQSSFAKHGVSCQDCHMPSVEGKAAFLGKIRDEIHSHKFYGGYTDNFLRDCADLDFEINPNNEKINIKIKVTNKTVGHALPTGSPMRMVLLSLEARDKDNNAVWKNWYSNPLLEDSQSVFMRLLEDKNGNAPVPPWEAARERYDQRLLPDESRILEYQFSDTSAVRLVATLTYRLAPPPLLKKLGITDELYTTPKNIVNKTIVISGQ